MASSPTEIRASNPDDRGVPTCNPLLSKWKTYGPVIVIIVGIGSIFGVGGAGLAGYFHVGALSNMAQIDAIIMMAAGGGSGSLFLIIGIVSAVKDRKVGSHWHYDLRMDSSEEDSESDGLTYQSSSTEKSEDNESSVDLTHRSNSEKIEETEFIDTQGGLVYGKEAWPVLGKKLGYKLEILDEEIPETPKVDLSKRSRILLYIPKKISVDGVEKTLTLETLIEMGGSLLTLIEIGGGQSKFFSPVKEKFMDRTASGWILMDKTVISKSRGKNYNFQKKMVKAKGCRMPRVLEAVVLNLMTFVLTGRRLYGLEPLTYTRCSEKTNGKPVIVGGFGSIGLSVVYFQGCDSDCNSNSDSDGVAAVWPLPMPDS